MDLLLEIFLKIVCNICIGNGSRGKVLSKCGRKSKRFIFFFVRFSRQPSSTVEIPVVCDKWGFPRGKLSSEGEKIADDREHRC